MEKVDYDARLHAAYAAGRQMSPMRCNPGCRMEAFARHLPQTRPLVWLDLGSGTGRMTLLGQCLRRPRERCRAVRQDACSSRSTGSCRRAQFRMRDPEHCLVDPIWRGSRR
jgi:hypothetical protein